MTTATTPAESMDGDLNVTPRSLGRINGNDRRVRGIADGARPLKPWGRHDG